MSTTKYDHPAKVPTDRAEKIRRLKERAIRAAVQVRRWEDLADHEALDLGGELEYLERQARSLGGEEHVRLIHGIQDDLLLKIRADRRGSALRIVLETMVRAMDGLGLTAADLLPYAWEVVRDTLEGEDDER